MYLSRILTLGLIAGILLARPVHSATFTVGDPAPYAAALLMEPESGSVLFAYNPHVQRAPASTIKLLLQLIVMEQLESGRYSLEDRIRVSARASRMGGSQVFLKHGEEFTLLELFEAIIIASANDASVSVAEHIGGTAEGFVDMMNDRARTLGLKNTYSVNVHGLDNTPMDARNLTTAYDLALIARALVAYPEIMVWSSIRYKPFRDGQFMLYNTNRLIPQYAGLDGLKTGYTRRAGYCLVATAQRHDMRLISVILGAGSERSRNQETARLLSWGFNHFTRVPLVQSGQLMGTVQLGWGREPEVRVIAQETAHAVLTPAQEQQLTRTMELPQNRMAPVQEGEGLGRLMVSLGDSLLGEFDLVAATAVERMTLWERLTSWF